MATPSVWVEAVVNKAAHLVSSLSLFIFFFFHFFPTSSLPPSLLNLIKSHNNDSFHFHYVSVCAWYSAIMYMCIIIINCSLSLCECF